MAKDYRRGPQVPPPPSTTKQRKPTRSCGWWLIVGVALGVVGSSILSSRSAGPA